MTGDTTRNHVLDRLRRFLGAKACRIQVAALPWRRSGGGVEVMLITSRDTGRWVIPKGWPEGNEALGAAAAREANEEAGVSGAVSAGEIGRYLYFKQLSSGAEKRCQVHVFALEIDVVRDKWPERKKRRRAWFSAAEAAKLVREPDLSELIANFGRNPRGRTA
ncbi:MAG: NUDIX hydrolase [Rhizobiaceae bacterium]|nr:NUDIX hydrolase [Rhizobiaceae bacterium]